MEASVFDSRAVHKVPAAGWDVGCNVERITVDVLQREGSLYLPKDNVPDMVSTIACFESLDPAVQRIYVFSAGSPTFVYRRDGQDWASRDVVRDRKFAERMEKENA
jgi:hypothetical protein